MDEKHWFNLVFANGAKVSNRVYSTDRKIVTAKMITQGKKDSGQSDTAVFLSASYLGFMTENEFYNE